MSAVVKYDNSVTDADANPLVPVRVAQAIRLGIAAAKASRMFTLSAFFIAAGSVMASVFFACKEDTDTAGHA